MQQGGPQKTLARAQCPQIEPASFRHAAASAAASAASVARATGSWVETDAGWQSTADSATGMSFIARRLTVCAINGHAPVNSTATDRAPAELVGAWGHRRTGSEAVPVRLAAYLFHSAELAQWSSYLSCMLHARPSSRDRPMPH